MKKIYGLILATIMFIPIVANAQEINYVNKNGINISESEYNRLLNMGFDEREISEMPLDIFNENKNLNGTVVDTQTKYFKTVEYVGYDTNAMLLTANNSYTVEVTKEEYESSGNGLVLMDASDTHQTTYKKLTTTITYVNSRYRVKNVLTWKQMPATRSNDIFAIAINNAVVEPLANSQKAYTNYTLFDTCVETSSQKTTNHTSWTKSPGGYGVTVPVPKDGSKTYTWSYGQSYPCTDNYVTPSGSKTVSLDVTAISSTMYYDLVKISSAAISAYGGYQHAQYSVSLSDLSFSVSYNGTFSASINIAASVASKYDGMGGTHAQVLNPVW